MPRSDHKLIFVISQPRSAPRCSRESSGATRTSTVLENPGLCCTLSMRFARAGIGPSTTRPSCGVLNAMARGVIPIVSHECAVDVGAAGIVLSDCRIPTIQEAVWGLSSTAGEVLQRRSEAVQDYIRVHHSPAGFAAAVSVAISTILGRSHHTSRVNGGY